LSDPSLQPKFANRAPNALDPGFLFKDLNERGGPASRPNFILRAGKTVQATGLVNPRNGRRLKTPVWGYGANTVSWPGQTIQVISVSAGGADATVVRWENKLGKAHLLPVDTSLHWCYSLHDESSANSVDYRQFSIEKDGVPIITHLHGGNSDFQFDGNPEFFYSPNNTVTGPQWDFVPGGFTNTFRYNNDVPAGNLWYHDHALGITRLNVYAGLAGFYFVRDEFDTGLRDNPLGLPAFPYELAYAVQDRMLTEEGALFYPAFPGDPFYDDFIHGEGAELPPDLFPGGGPTALAEFFGDHMLVNGMIWPKTNVEPRAYRIHLLNGCDSRFMAVRFRAVSLWETDPSNGGTPIPFWVIGSDQGLASAATETDILLFEPGGRYDLVFDFSDPALAGMRVIMENNAGDAPFGGAIGDDLTEEDLFSDRQTDRIMAFDVVLPYNTSVPDAFDPSSIAVYAGNPNPVSRVRRVALFEGTDEFGRLQPLLGTVNDDSTATPYAWFQPATETPALDATEIWEIYNFTADAHPIHLHLVNFQILGRQDFTYVIDGTQPVLQHNGAFGEAPNVTRVKLSPQPVDPGPGFVENAPKDMVISLPGDPEAEPKPTGQMVRIKATFDKPGRYVWHCHILSHEDHEMMRVLEVD
jgi:FtsP/CotA-like multicopper oxidase with cupredoxin domain